MSNPKETTSLSGNFILSPDYEIIPPAKWKKIQQKNIAPLDSIGLMQHRKNKLFVFNIVVGGLIKRFKKAAIGNQTIDRYAHALGLEDKKSKDKLTSLFKELYHKRILIPVDLTSPIKHKNKYLYYKRGTALGHYTIGTKLNSHEQLHAYSAFNKLKKKFIIKAYYPDRSIDKNLLQNLHLTLQREITILKYLRDSPYINQIKAYHPKKNYAVLHFFDGISLKQFVEREHNHYNLSTVYTLMDQITEAFAFIHQKKYVHGDVHDKNILIDAKHRIQIIDFGLSMHVSEEQIEHIRKGGIHQFLPPERITNNVFSYIQKNPNYTSDIYQIGIIIYFLLYRSYPFETDSWKQKTKWIQKGKIKWNKKTAWGELIPASLLHLIQQCTATAPADRIENGGTLYLEWKKIRKGLK